jgi:hypothetical protein
MFGLGALPLYGRSYARRPDLLLTRLADLPDYTQYKSINLGARMT